MGKPQLTVVTPLYNAEPYLAECIESVLQQTYPNWDYVIVDNCSTDGSLEIANRYARGDHRIRVLRNRSFVGIIENHNIAVCQTAPSSKYCKVVSADDWLFPECLTRMVDLAEEHPSVAIVGSYQLSGGESGWKILWDDISYPSRVVPGPEFCRSHLLNHSCAFGTPTSCLYRADLIKDRGWFYPHLLPHADDSAFYEHLRSNDFGFVHQVLSFWRIHGRSTTAAVEEAGAHDSAALRDLLTYGPFYLTEEEYENRLDRVLDEYYSSLAVNFFHGRGRDFWRYHREELDELGYSFFGRRLAKAVGARFMDLLLNPKQTVEKFFQRRERGTARSRTAPAFEIRTALDANTMRELGRPYERRRP